MYDNMRTTINCSCIRVRNSGSVFEDGQGHFYFSAMWYQHDTIEYRDVKGHESSGMRARACHRPLYSRESAAHGSGGAG